MIKIKDVLQLYIFLSLQLLCVPGGDSDGPSTVRIRPSILSVIRVFIGGLCRKRPKCVGCKIISFDL